jgi:galactokinase/mevalonate kinase-like predicted kinase
MDIAQRLVTLPPRMAQSFAALEGKTLPDWFATHDPGKPLGSGAGTVHALREACRAEGGHDVIEWLRSRRRIVIHAGGQSRRLPAYASVGKVLMPVPVLRGSTGQAPDQTLLDLLIDFGDRLFDRAPDELRVMILAGDVLLRVPHLPRELPSGDVVCLGMRADAATASHHGAFFVRHDAPDTLEFVLQKPPVERIIDLEATHGCLLDVGVWLLSERAVKALSDRTGTPEAPQEYDLYGEFGLALGEHPTEADASLSALAARVVPVRGDFLHFGTSVQMIESVTALHDQAHHAAPLGFLSSGKRHPDQHVQNVQFDGKPDLAPRARLWLENAHLAPGWRLAGDNVVTGVPDPEWNLSLAEGICLDIAPVEGGLCLRPYGFQDPFKGPIGDPNTLFLGGSLADWMAARGVTAEDLGGPATDIQAAKVFPVVADSQDAFPMLRWLLGQDLEGGAVEAWRRAPRLSASDLLANTDVDRLYRERSQRHVAGLKAMQRNNGSSVFYSLDLERSAELIHAQVGDYIPDPLQPGASLVKRMHHHMFASAVLRLQGENAWEAEESKAFGVLREAIVESLPEIPRPRCGVASDQIVWARSPLRFDLAGGWTDTPPYCQLNGGRVLNVAVDLNGQPPVQVFVRRSNRPDVLLRSIDLGTERRFTSFEELNDDLSERSEFSLAQGALSLAGFGRESGAPSLAHALEEFGGGIELSILAAVPKGSGLGTSSVLASTILAAIGSFGDLGWTQREVMHRTLALEQILSTGGGWQDQAGGCLPGLKDLETSPGPVQDPVCRWLPDRLLGPEYANGVALLYYTGITRVAKSVLREIVRGMFLNSGSRLSTLGRIRENVQSGVDAIQRGDLDALGETVRRSWKLNQELDSGTNPPAVQAIMAQVEDYLLGAKLLGAGGGGFLFIIAKDASAAARIRETLTANPPSDRARFFDFAVSGQGLQVTKS